MFGFALLALPYFAGQSIISPFLGFWSAARFITYLGLNKRALAFILKRGYITGF
jgi:hypothetical protein